MTPTRGASVGIDADGTLTNIPGRSITRPLGIRRAASSISASVGTSVNVAAGGVVQRTEHRHLRQHRVDLRLVAVLGRGSPPALDERCRAWRRVPEPLDERPARIGGGHDDRSGDLGAVARGARRSRRSSAHTIAATGLFVRSVPPCCSNARRSASGKRPLPPTGRPTWRDVAHRVARARRARCRASRGSRPTPSDRPPWPHPRSDIRREVRAHHVGGRAPAPAEHRRQPGQAFTQRRAGQPAQRSAGRSRPSGSCAPPAARPRGSGGSRRGRRWCSDARWSSVRSASCHVVSGSRRRGVVGPRDRGAGRVDVDVLETVALEVELGRSPASCGTSRGRSCRR